MHDSEELVLPRFGGQVVPGHWTRRSGAGQSVVRCVIVTHNRFTTDLQLMSGDYATETDDWCDAFCAQSLHVD